MEGGDRVGEGGSENRGEVERMAVGWESEKEGVRVRE